MWDLSSPTKDWTHVPCIAKWILNHWTTSEVPGLYYFDNPINHWVYLHICGEGNDTHSSTLAWKIPWMKEPGGLQSMGSLRVGHNWATSLSRIEKGNGSPLQCSCLENPRDGGAWWAAVYGVIQSRTQLKRLSSSSRSSSSSSSMLETAWLLRDVTYSSKL